jgi:hypothetical protein
VRRITHSGEDVQLALSYYGDMNILSIRTAERKTIYSTYKPLNMVANKVKHIIEEDPRRSPEKTAEHFKFFVSHYKQEEYSEDRYVFDRHFSTEEKSIWQSLFSVFTHEELLAVLKIYPTIVRYIDNASLIQSWLEQKLNDDSTLSDWQEVKKMLG